MATQKDSVGIGYVGNDMPLEYLLSQKRAGIVPYRIDQKGQIRFIWGIDTGSSDITDLGGRTESNDRDSLDTAIREFREESFGVFGRITRDQIGRSLAIYRKDLLIIFVRLDYDPQVIMNLFQQRKQYSSRPEIDRLIEIDKFELIKMVCNPGTMYEFIRILIRDTLVRHGNFLC